MLLIRGSVIQVFLIIICNRQSSYNSFSWLLGRYSFYKSIYIKWWTFNQRWNGIRVFCFFILGLFICLFVFEINYEDAIKILYTFPKRAIHIFISLFLNYLNLKVSYLMISQYFEIQEQVILRKDYSYFYKLIFMKSIIFICIFTLIHILLFLLLFS